MLTGIGTYVKQQQNLGRDDDCNHCIEYNIIAIDGQRTPANHIVHVCVWSS